MTLAATLPSLEADPVAAGVAVAALVACAVLCVAGWVARRRS
jgi:hypothetical protein